MQHYLDTVKYGNMKMAGRIDNFWLNDSLQISPDEEMGFLKKLYFTELPVSERSQRIVKTMMLQEEHPATTCITKPEQPRMILWSIGL